MKKSHLALLSVLMSLSWLMSQPTQSVLAAPVILFEDDFTGPLTWVVSDPVSVYIKDNQFLFIDSYGAYGDYAYKTFSILLSEYTNVVIEQRIKLESGGLNYRLPYEIISFDDESGLHVTYLPTFPWYDPTPYGWAFGFGASIWTGINEPGIPGGGWYSTATADYWTVTRIVISASKGELCFKPDDLAREWFSDGFLPVTSVYWSHALNEILEIRFVQPWNSVNYVDYIRITGDGSECPSVPVGGAAVPANALAIVAPWLAVIGLVGCISTAVVVAKKRR